MNGGIEAAGDIATGALIGRAVESEAGEQHGQGTHGGGLCLNCGTALQGEFCFACGQTVHIHNTLHSLFHDLLHGVFHFEGKIWRTLPMLFRRPGQLTRRYIAGERARFISPLALFLFSVFLMVATIETIGGPFFAKSHVKGPDKVLVSGKVAEQLKQARATETALVAERKRLNKADADTDAVDEKIDGVREQIKALRATGVAIDTANTDMAKLKVDTGNAFIDDRAAHVLKEPRYYAYKLQSTAYKFSWALIPISLPFIWLLFAFRRDVGPYDHAIFAIYSLSAMTLGVVGLSILRWIGIPGTLIWLAIAIGGPFHMYRQLKGAYGLTRGGALWRTAALVLFAGLACALFFALLVGFLVGPASE
ncbi:DUF3667 domain-containing protein [Sphingomonas immobilis]|uniref:DUF3667 domain-containing protein n=1 Tax=Sphingomonas immobilis TaxID=3063997 RepID=A0ABT8ZVU0_9SPHN|nr:DUF3667 domain-containing protein [Sphingomonas sp. CA1-15]